MATGILNQSDIKQKYRTQKSVAKRRGIEWKLTFEQWLAWWGSDLSNRGTGKNKLQMQRLHDKGAYEIGNIVKGYPLQNAITRGNCILKKNQDKKAAEHQKRLDAMMFEPSLEDSDDFLENEYENEMKSNGVINYRTFCADR